MTELTTYRQKRNFTNTKEPKGSKAAKGSSRFVVQRHHATHLHYDFRLELGGVLKSWAVPKGPSLNPSQKRLAVMVEDHPVDYINFHGTIPKGNYGAGRVEIWDKGNFIPLNNRHEKITEKEALQHLKKGELKFELKGKKLKGEFVLVNIKRDEKNWLLIKHRDEHSVNTIYDAEETVKKITADKPQVASIRHGRAKKLAHFIKPMLASVAKVPFDDDEWLFEIKWDGYRAIAEWDTKQLRFYSRNGIDFTERFPSIANALKKLNHAAILDGEVVLLNEKNLPDFQKLQHYENHLNYPLVYYAFDLLALDGKKTTQLALHERKELLKKLIKQNRIIQYSDHVTGQGISFFEKARERGLEGVMAKKADSSYAAGYRSKEWLKIKNIQSTEAVIVGYTAPRGGRHYFGSIVLANKKNKGWQYRGHAGTGFNEEMLQTLYNTMQPLVSKQSPFKNKVPVNNAVTWLRPQLVADIAYTEITKDGIFRHPVFLRLRTEKKLSEMNDESESAAAPPAKEEKRKAGTFTVALTNLHKIFWPNEGYTKADLINYYDAVAGYILPHLKNRPLSLKRNPNGIQDEGFFHKDAGEHAPSYVKVFPVESESSHKTIDYIVCNNKATLLYIANLGCIEMNPWNSTMQHPDKPTWMVIDIDPSEKNTFDEVIDAALAVKEIFDKANVPCYCKTSGATGLHVYVPLHNKYDYSTVKEFAQLTATLVHEQLPAITTLQRNLSKRKPREIYIDFLQNRISQTLACAYSVRPKPGAPVSAPLHWSEVKHGLHPSQFTIQNMLQRLQKNGDIFSNILKQQTNIAKALKLLSA